jgi:hypothetical protein
MSRRTAPTAGRQQRAPQPSIKSSQVFAPQPSQNLTQQQQLNAKKQLQQQQLQQQMKPSYQPEYQEEYGDKETGGNITKMTVAQAITLITLRLGSIETKLMNNDLSYSGGENLSVFSDRLDALETKINLSTNVDYKQQIDHLTQAIIQSKNLSTTIVKENKELKSQLALLKKELSDSKELIEMVRKMAVSNETKILQMLNMPDELQVDENLEDESVMNLSDSDQEIDVKDVSNNENDEELQIENDEQKNTISYFE